MQLDIGWASVAGQDILAMFKKNPGRFECWHVKDAMGMKSLAPDMTQNQRQQAAKLVPVGQGEVDYKAIFAAASAGRHEALLHRAGQRQPVGRFGRRRARQPERPHPNSELRTGESRSAH